MAALRAVGTLSARLFGDSQSYPYVEFEDGVYTLTAKVTNSDGFDDLEMYAKSAGQKFSTQISDKNSTWKTVRVDRIQVSGNKVEIGFFADAKADAFCRVDDVTLVLAD